MLQFPCFLFGDLLHLMLGKKVIPLAFSAILLFLLYPAMATCRMITSADLKPGKTITVGVARINITPDGPIRLSGYGDRKTESEGVLQALSAKALAFGTDKQGPSILITVDLIGIPGFITSRITKRLLQKAGIDSTHITICTSHTHGSPEVGTLLNHFGNPLPPDQLACIIRYQE